MWRHVGRTRDLIYFCFAILREKFPCIVLCYLEMDNQYYYKLMASYLSKRNCDESLMRYLFGKNSVKKSPEELERADERKRRLQRERSRRYRALKNARRQHEGSGSGKEQEQEARARERRVSEGFDEEAASEGDEPPTLCHLESDGGGSDDNSAGGGGGGGTAGDLRPLSLKEFLSAPNTELDYPTVHSLMFHWLQT